MSVRLLATLCFFLALTTLLPAQFIGTGSARLTGIQEAIPVTSTGSGTVEVTIAEVGGNNVLVTVTGSFEDLTSPVDTEIGGGAHIHVGLPGSNGPVIIGLTPTLTDGGRSGIFAPGENTFTVSRTIFDNAPEAAVYVNIHTENFPGGELRGIVTPTSEREKYYLSLLGANEVPSVVTPAFGALYAEFDPADNLLYVTGSFNNLTGDLATNIGGGAHLHEGLPGENGPVRIALTADTDSDDDDDDRSGIFTYDDNTFTLTEDQVDMLRNGRLYANIHSAEFPSGELRGQLLPLADAVFRAHLSGANEWPVVTSGGSGQVLGHVVGDDLRLIGSFGDLSDAVATSIAGGVHLHTGMAGQNGPVIIPVAIDLAEDSLSATVSLEDNRFVLEDGQLTALFNRGVYFNVHSKTETAGEIRGQMLGQSQSVFTSFLTGNEQIPGVVTAGRGMVKVEMNGGTFIASGSFTDLSSDLNATIAGGAHIHAGYPGQSGPVIFPLTVMAGDDARAGTFMPNMNRFAAGSGGADSLMRRFLYVNVHSLDHPGGEIRGSLLGEAESYFLAPLSGASQPDMVMTDATGMVAAEVTDTTVMLVGSFMGLDSDFAEDVGGGIHLHNAIAGSNGGVVVPLTIDPDDSDRSAPILLEDNRLELTPAQLTELMERRMYVNVHTEDNRSGAIRGQLLPLAGTYLHTTLMGANATNFVTSTAQGGLKAEITDSVLTVSGSVSMLDGDFDASIGGGAHLHLGASANNGPVSIPLNADAAEDLKSVSFAAAENTFRLSADQLTALRSNGMYANIHTTTVRSGEARGQLVGELNLAPDSSMILSPADGASLTLEGRADSAFVATYSSSTDPSGDSVMYIWQLAADEDFETIVLAVNTGRDTFFATDFGTVDSLLSDVGVDAGASATVYHRVLASDGSNFRAGEAAAVTLTRGQIVGTRTFRPEGFVARAFPNPSRPGANLTYEITTRETFRAELRLITALGQLRSSRTLTATPGTQRVRLGVDLPAGTYFVQLRSPDGRLIDTSRLLIQ